MIMAEYLEVEFTAKCGSKIEVHTKVHIKVTTRGLTAAYIKKYIEARHDCTNVNIISWEQSSEQAYNAVTKGWNNI